MLFDVVAASLSDLRIDDENAPQAELFGDGKLISGDFKRMTES